MSQDLPDFLLELVIICYPSFDRVWNGIFSCIFIIFGSLWEYIPILPMSLLFIGVMAMDKDHPLSSLQFPEHLQKGLRQAHIAMVEELHEMRRQQREAREAEEALRNPPKPKPRTREEQKEWENEQLIKTSGPFDKALTGAIKGFMAGILIVMIGLAIHGNYLDMIDPPTESAFFAIPFFKSSDIVFSDYMHNIFLNESTIVYVWIAATTFIGVLSLWTWGAFENDDEKRKKREKREKDKQENKEDKEDIHEFDIDSALTGFSIGVLALLGWVILSIYTDTSDITSSDLVFSDYMHNVFNQNNEAIAIVGTIVVLIITYLTWGGPWPGKDDDKNKKKRENERDKPTFAKSKIANPEIRPAYKDFNIPSAVTGLNFGIMLAVWTFLIFVSMYPIDITSSDSVSIDYMHNVFNHDNEVVLVALAAGWLIYFAVLRFLLRGQSSGKDDKKKEEKSKEDKPEKSEEDKPENHKKISLLIPSLSQFGEYPISFSDLVFSDYMHNVFLNDSLFEYIWIALATIFAILAGYNRMYPNSGDDWKKKRANEKNKQKTKGLILTIKDSTIACIWFAFGIFLAYLSYNSWKYPGQFTGKDDKKKEDKSKEDKSKEDKPEETEEDKLEKSKEEKSKEDKPEKSEEDNPENHKKISLLIPSLSQFGEYPISFSDAASVYAYHLFSVHHDVMRFLIIIIVFVYWMLYKIIRDFHWRSFNNQNSLLIPLYSYFIKIEVKIKLILKNFFLYLIKSYSYCRDVRDIYNLGAVTEVNDFIFQILMWYQNRLNVIFGFCETYYLFSSLVKDIDGNVFSNDERVLFDVQWRNFCFEDYHKCLYLLTEKEVKMYIIEKYLSYSLFHYTTNAYFYNGYINVSQFFLRKLQSLNQIANYAIFNILDLISKNFRNIPRANKVFSYDFNLRDALFEAYDFKHSFTFEVIWAICPTIIIINILVPSLYLLYSLDEDLDPQLTFKVIGHHGIDLMSLIIDQILFKGIELNLNIFLTNLIVYSFNRWFRSRYEAFIRGW